MLPVRWNYRRILGTRYSRCFPPSIEGILKGDNEDEYDKVQDDDEEAKEEQGEEEEGHRNETPERPVRIKRKMMMRHYATDTIIPQ
jgi:hypothetical protein